MVASIERTRAKLVLEHSRRTAEMLASPTMLRPMRVPEELSMPPPVAVLSRKVLKPTGLDGPVTDLCQLLDGAKGIASRYFAKRASDLLGDGKLFSSHELGFPNELSHNQEESSNLAEMYGCMQPNGHLEIAENFDIRDCWTRAGHTRERCSEDFNFHPRKKLRRVDSHCMNSKETLHRPDATN